MSIGITILIAFTALSLFSYCVLMGYYGLGISKLKTPQLNSHTACTKISVVVCFRDEAGNLESLLKSLLQQDYPQHLYEIILYNDVSGDGSIAIIKNILAQYPSGNVILRDVPYQTEIKSPKKIALIDAATQSEADLMVVTDADCLLHPQWLSAIEYTYQKEQALLISGGVALVKEKGWIFDLQSLELIALAAVSAGAIAQQHAIMCNGANLAFDRKTFLQLKPYQYNYHISSGDDMFLMMSMQALHPHRIHYVAHPFALVYTKGKKRLSDYLNQRIRWASKSKNYRPYHIKLVAITVLAMNMLPIVALGLLLKGYWLTTALFLLIKQAADMWVMRRFCRMMDVNYNSLKLFLFQSVESVLTLVIALKSISGSYVWKGRKEQF